MAAAMRQVALCILQRTGLSRTRTYVYRACFQISNSCNAIGLLNRYSKTCSFKSRKNVSKLYAPKARVTAAIRNNSRASIQNLSRVCDSTKDLSENKQPSIAKRKDIRESSILVDYLNRMNVDTKKLSKRLDIDRLNIGDVKKRMKFLSYELNLESSDLGKIVSQRPVILLLKEELLRNRLEVVRKVGISYEAASYMVKQTPGILTSKLEESLPSKVEFLMNLKVVPRFSKNDVLHLLTKCPDLIASCRLESLKNKIDFLQNKLEFNKHQLRNILIKQPSILTFSTQAVGEKFKYCFEKLNASPSSIARCPRIFQCSIKRIRERHLFLVHTGRLKEDMIIDDYGLGVILTSTDPQFATKVAQSTQEDFNYFRKNLK